MLPAHAAQQLPRAYPIGVSLIPTPYPERAFRDAVKLQSAWNELYRNVVVDADRRGEHSFLFAAIKDLVELDPFVNVLWKIHMRALEVSNCTPSLWVIHRWMMTSGAIVLDAGACEANTFSFLLDTLV